MLNNIYKNHLSQILSEAGLDTDTQEIYLLLLYQGSLSISQIAKSLNIYRSKVYKLIDVLKTLDLVFLEDKKVRLTRIDNLYNLLEIKRQSILNSQQGFLKIQNSLIANYNYNQPSSSIETFVGIQEFNKGFASIVMNKSNLDQVRIYFDSSFFEIVSNDFFKTLIKTQKIQTKNLKKLLTEKANYPVLNPELGFESKFLTDKFKNPGGWSVSGNELVIYNTQLPKIVIIRDPDIVKTFKEFFDHLWERVLV